MTDARTDQPQEPTEPESMGIDPWERNWMRFTTVLLLLFGITIVAAGFALGFQVPGNEARVDPATVADSEPWSSPGLREIVPGEEYEVYMLSRIWAFEPRELTVPLGAKITFFVTSVDVQHGFKLQDTNVNMQIVPGEVSKLSVEFDRLGEFPYICTEFCGIGHAAMFGTLNVVTPAEFEEQGGAS